MKGPQRQPLSPINQAILDLVRECPGIASREISELLDIPTHKLSAQTCFLRDRRNLIENRGKTGNSFLWYPVTKESENRVPYIYEARDILKGMMATPVASREKYLAGRLQQLMESEEA